MAKKKYPPVTVEEARRGIYIDFEGTMKDSASFLGVLVVNDSGATEFGASGTHTLEGFEAAGQFLLVISADAGPVGLMIDEGDGPRQVYGSPPGSEISTYETGWMGGGTITVSVEAPAEANWRLVAIASP
ncbi:MAG: hypothetical protein HOF87_17185 [Gemmatimonadales bacterium]|nr:hypothetical protein [Gemmatimonadales bacterium]